MVGEYVKSAVYGGLDGAITTLVVALSGIGSSTAAHVILALGFSSLLGNAISMAFADYLGTKSDL
jgi:VIT1/CCC1 family predicted Fe2+/Mn2+ transporter